MADYSLTISPCAVYLNGAPQYIITETETEIAGAYIVDATGRYIVTEYAGLVLPLVFKLSRGVATSPCEVVTSGTAIAVYHGKRFSIVLGHLVLAGTKTTLTYESTPSVVYYTCSIGSYAFALTGIGISTSLALGIVRNPTFTSVTTKYELY